MRKHSFQKQNRQTGRPPRTRELQSQMWEGSEYRILPRERIEGRVWHLTRTFQHTPPSGNPHSREQTEIAADKKGKLSGIKWSYLPGNRFPPQRRGRQNSDTHQKYFTVSLR